MRTFPPLGALAGVILASATAGAQPAPPAPSPPQPAADPGAPPGPPPARRATDPVEPAEVPAPPRDHLVEALEPSPSGLTLEQAAARGASTAPSVRAAQTQVNAAQARLHQALAAYFPRVTLSASYTRLSPVNNTLDFGLPPEVENLFGDGSALAFPVIVNSYQLATAVEVPLSDYLLRLTQAYAGVSNDIDARKLETQARALDAARDAKVAYLSWARSKGQRAVAEMAVEQSRSHLQDAERGLAAGVISTADKLRIEAQLAQAEHLGRAAENLERTAEFALRTVLHMPGGPPLELGTDVLGAPSGPTSIPLEQLQKKAVAQRVELKALERSEAALGESVSVTRAGLYPTVDAFANLLYANPNPRVFPQSERFDFTWEVGVRMRWTVNDTFQTLGAAAEAEAGLEQVRHQRAVLEDGIRVAVAQAYFEAQTAQSALTAAVQAERAASGSLLARRQLFRWGKATATDLVDAETELTRARLQRVDAHVEMLMAKVKLDHALGR